MLLIPDENMLTVQQKEYKLEVILILDEALKQSNIDGLSARQCDDQIQCDDITWLGWTVVNGTAEDVATLIESKLPLNPLLGMFCYSN